MKPIYKIISYAIVVPLGVILIYQTHTTWIVVGYLLISSFTVACIDRYKEIEAINKLVIRYNERYPDSKLPLENSPVIDKITSILKAIWGNIWPTTELHIILNMGMIMEIIKKCSANHILWLN